LPRFCASLFCSALSIPSFFKPVFAFAEKSFFGGKELKVKIETNHKRFKQRRRNCCFYGLTCRGDWLGKVTGSIEIEASPEKVFAFVIDMKKMNDASKEWYEGKWTSEGPISLGSTAYYVGTHKYNKGEEWNAAVTEFVKNKSLTMLLKGANKHTHDQTNYHALEPTTKGTKFTISMEYEMPSIRGKLLDVLVARRMVGGWLAKIAENLKKAVEAS